jgi:glycosyltransferase involved in cell wall biosynthesis
MPAYQGCYSVKRVWFDVTEIQDWAGHFTGIQRVIFNIGMELVKDSQFEIRFCRYNREQKIFVETAYEFMEQEYSHTADSSEIMPISLQVKALRKFTNSLPARPKRAARRVINKSHKLRSRKSIVPVDVAKEDIFFVPGAFWTEFLDALAVLKQQSGALVMGMAYDVAPAVASQFSAEVTVSQYKQELPKALQIFDHWLSISKNTKTDLLEYANANQFSLQAEAVTVIKLGSDINPQGESIKPAEHIPEKFILLVSTLEARKNQALVYQAVKRAEEKSINLPPILLVGKHGWLSDDLIYQLRNDKSIKDKLIWLPRVDDMGLRWLYQNCLFTLYPSFYEGWGLPVAESLAYGKFCIASNSSSIPEAGGEVVAYHSPYSGDELLDLIMKYQDTNVLKDAEKKISHLKVQTWEETGRQVLSALSTL